MIRIVPRIFSTIHFYNMGIRVFTLFYLSYNLFAADVFSFADIVSFISTARAVVVSYYLCHFSLSIFCKIWMFSLAI